MRKIIKTIAIITNCQMPCLVLSLAMFFVDGQQNPYWQYYLFMAALTIGAVVIGIILGVVSEFLEKLSE